MALRTFLASKAAELLPQLSFAMETEGVTVRYEEDVNPDALTRAWLDNRTSYIWKVGVLTLADNNKLDWIHVLIGHEREPGKLELVGRFDYEDGENDDPARSVARAVELMGVACRVFRVDPHDRFGIGPAVPGLDDEAG
jgi:hypothetical protein